MVQSLLHMSGKSLSTALQRAAIALEDASDTPRLDAELLAAHGLGIDRMNMLARLPDLHEPANYAGLIARRAAYEPVAYITGYQPFWDIDLEVSPGVLIPRSDSETLIETAQCHFAAHAPPRHILDLGTGSGALLLAALSLYRDAAGVGIDASTTALNIAHGNAQRLELDGRCNFAAGNWHDDDWADQVKALHTGTPAQFDLILCNPPYIRDGARLSPMVREYEPHEALYAGPEGLDDYRRIIPHIPQLLSPHGIACFEIGYDQADAVRQLAAISGFDSKLTRDLAGQPRCIAMWRDVARCGAIRLDAGKRK